MPWTAGSEWSYRKAITLRFDVESYFGDLALHTGRVVLGRQARLKHQQVQGERPNIRKEIARMYWWEPDWSTAIWGNKKYHKLLWLC